MYQEGWFPGKMNNSIFITLPKVSGTAKCEKHRTIRLMSHVTKLVLRVFMNNIRPSLSPMDLWTDPAGVTALLVTWAEKLVGGPQAGTSDPPTSKGHGSG